MFKHKKQSGFTLLELVIVIIIVGIVVVGSSELLLYGFKGFAIGKQQVEANWQGQVSLERMVRDLRAIRSSSSISQATANAITFTDIDGESIQYHLTGQQLMRNTRVLSDDIQSLTFSYYDEDGNSTVTINNIRYIVVALQIMNGSSSFILTTAVYPWGLK
ncbi:MAG: prepilin-type N-terminal cleavage/methylation domain-containing protein [Pseudomonadota bacterium]|nr:prepilin-type N-terminal cleavage/methylation domain-containing protein [Gammaproteobacteria bacterium]MBU1558895.1 prepilin-type N-terminal cleavage/methylation domain-containing protein [Gammaproteobacteria bacterium]MBU1628820.1 prepilin-type N-terminal cleavage/methylation domain-containing protein [Gammaproteobacteria bacterium]MBU1926609.1 prepilin-type N-terminal cleavage/methylation domain-containing protein [Gammaproteobacteria bacterium]MBU2545834.1 prepilin-type N-terminal cleavag